MPLLSSAKALLVANLVPVFGVLALGWSLGDLLLLYWAEALAVGLLAVMRLADAPGLVRSRRPAIVIFGVHFGLFAAAYWLLVSALASGSLAGVALGRIPVLGFLAFFVSHGLSYLDNYYLGDERARTNVWSETTGPYWRLVPTHAAAVAAFLVLSFADRYFAAFPSGGLTAWLVGLTPPLALIAVKTVFDLRSHLAVHRDRFLPHPKEEGEAVKTEKALAMIATALGHKEEDVGDGRPLP